MTLLHCVSRGVHNAETDGLGDALVQRYLLKVHFDGEKYGTVSNKFTLVILFQIFQDSPIQDA